MEEGGGSEDVTMKKMKKPIKKMIKKKRKADEDKVRKDEKVMVKKKRSKTIEPVREDEEAESGDDDAGRECGSETGLHSNEQQEFNEEDEVNEVQSNKEEAATEVQSNKEEVVTEVESNKEEVVTEVRTNEQDDEAEVGEEEDENDKLLGSERGLNSNEQHELNEEDAVTQVESNKEEVVTEVQTNEQDEEAEVEEEEDENDKLVIQEERDHENMQYAPPTPGSPVRVNDQEAPQALTYIRPEPMEDVEDEAPNSLNSNNAVASVKNVSIFDGEGQELNQPSGKLIDAIVKKNNKRDLCGTNCGNAEKVLIAKVVLATLEHENIHLEDKRQLQHTSRMIISGNICECIKEEIFVEKERTPARQVMELYPGLLVKSTAKNECNGPELEITDKENNLMNPSVSVSLVFSETRCLWMSETISGGLIASVEGWKI